MGKKKVEEEEWRGGQSILSSVKIPGLMSSYYFIITVKKTEDALSSAVDWWCFLHTSRPCTTHL